MTKPVENRYHRDKIAEKQEIAAIDGEHDQFEASLEKARAFFTRAEEVASADNFDYAIEMYLDGIKLCPDALEDGHAPLRRLALIRQGKGGKKPSMIEKAKRMGGKKNPLDQLINAEFLMAKDPDHLPYAEDMLKACVAGGYTRTADWIAQLIFDANRASSKPSFSTYILLKDSYTKMQMFTKAVSACKHAVDMRPNDAALRDELRDLSASMTMEKGGYGKAADFRESIKDRQAQDRLHSQDQAVKSAEYRDQAVLEARRQVQQAPTVTNVLQLAQALADLDTEESWGEVVKLLQDSYEKSKDFSYMRKLGELEIRRIKAQLRQLYGEIKKKGDDESLKSRFQALTTRLDKTEMEHFRTCMENYPTDHKMKYEYGRCLLKGRKFDEAIPMFQDAQRDPRLRVMAIDKAGLCFLLKGWYDDAIDLFKEAIKLSPTQESTTAKDIRYNLARAYEAAGRDPEALEIYRKLAQLDFSYKDVSQRIDKLRSKGHND